MVLINILFFNHLEEVIRTQIDELSREISKRMGMSDEKVDQSLQRIADVTTSSMEAYNYFLKGKEANTKLYYEEARKFFEKAVEHDPEFATAYFYLANVHSWLGNLKGSNEAYVKAKEFLHKTSGKERLYLEARIARHTSNSRQTNAQSENALSRPPAGKRSVAQTVEGECARPARGFQYV